MDPPNFKLAEEYARNPAQLDQVWTSQAEYYYEKKMMNKAAVFFAKTKYLRLQHAPFTFLSLQ